MTLFKAAVKCPYCAKELAEKPARKKKCPHCSQYIYVRQGKPLTEKQALENDLERRWLGILERYDVSERMVRGIATITVIEGQWLFETKDALNTKKTPPPWADYDRYAGIHLTGTEQSISCHTIEAKRVDALLEWLKAVALGE